MNHSSLRHFVFGMLMLVAAGLAFAMTPSKKIADTEPKLNLETMIPKQFGEWKLDTSMVPIVSNPQQQANINRIYNQTLSRTYVNSAGKYVMLEIAYGGNQSDDMQVHHPEVCYPAQGFELLKQNTGILETPFGQIPVRRLVAKQGERVEPITYWITVGNEVTASGLQQKLAQIKYGLTGKIPDGLLFRISSIQRDDEIASKTQNEFVRELLSTLTPNVRERLIGKPSS